WTPPRSTWAALYPPDDVVTQTKDGTPMRHRKNTAVIAGAAAATLLLAACGGGDGDSAADASTGSGGGSSEGQTMRLALNQTEEHPSYIALDNFGSYLEENTGGWGIDVFPNETLGAQAEALQLVSDGSVDMAIVSGTQLENLNKDFVVFNLPKVFDDVEHQMSVIHDPELTGDLFSSLEESNNITVLGCFAPAATAIYTSDGPVETPADLAGKKIRVQ